MPDIDQAAITSGAMEGRTAAAGSGERDSTTVGRRPELAYIDRRMMKTLSITAITALLLAGCARGERDIATSQSDAAVAPLVEMIGGASSDRMLLAASAQAKTELASADQRASGLPARRPRSDGEEVGASMGSSSWKVNRDPKHGQGELCAIQNYYLAPKGTR